ncbi:MAG: GNAT family N-acetyltransferase [Gammaproteobacteria bacterium]|nr:GNAT family N-acetyltransferase [Gammaproteobacteria bacterium]MDH5728819.1 GNAT family N-acetyltransferase [Gammaproteobacteria bacterium]
MNIEIVEADYLNKQHEQEIPMLLNQYASDVMGGSQGLSDYAKNNLVKELAKIPHAFTIIAYVDGEPAGLINCFEAFSTFSCKPLVNIHDVVVLEPFRAQGISQQMLSKVEAIARSKACCKITLEVLTNNKIAKSAYSKFGFTAYELDSDAGAAEFWQKLL